jgi:aspartyl protease family protein
MPSFKNRWLIFMTIPSVAKANDPGLCFMVTSSGKKISLGQMGKCATLNQ